jgi:ADP-ribose pyrophosphatase
MSSLEPVPWQQIDSQVIFEHPRLSLVEDTVILPSGKQTEWLRFKARRDFVLIICVDVQRRILLARQYCHPVGRVVHEFPGGNADVGESYEDAARRELMEEVGWYPHQLEAIGAFLAHVRRASLKGRVFVATELEERRLPSDQEEIIASEWVDIPTMEARIGSGELDNGQLLAAWSLFRIRKPGYFS